MQRRIRSSRLTRYAEKQSKRQFLLFGLATIILLVLLFTFGATVLNIFGNVIFGIRGDEEALENQTLDKKFLSPPRLSLDYDATSSAEITVSGKSAYKEGEISLFVNNSEYDTEKLNNKTEFTFKDVELKKGENTLKAQYQIDGEKSEFSSPYTIIRVSDKPLLEISGPSNNSTFTRADKKITIEGKTDPSNTVTINGFRAIVDKDGNFSYLYELSEGENKINIVAENKAGLNTSEELVVTYRAD